MWGIVEIKKRSDFESYCLVYNSLHRFVFAFIIREFDQKISIY
jgi:hypothetical protein